MFQFESIEKLVHKLGDSEEGEIISYIEDSYLSLAELQKKWYSDSEFYCPDGCGDCCHNFEPELLESEALYMAAWLIVNKKEWADSLAYGKSEKFYEYEENSGLTEKTCIFFNAKSDYHCSIYGGRPFLCRLFGASSFRDKNGNSCWKPCKFYPSEKLEKYRIPLVHKQYSASEIESVFGSMPPVMSNIMEVIVNQFPGRSETVELRKSLPEMIRKIYWLLMLNDRR